MAFGVWFRYDMMHGSVSEMRGGIVPTQWFTQNHLVDPIVKGLGFGWKISRPVICRQGRGQFISGNLSEVVSPNGKYTSVFQPSKPSLLPSTGWKDYISP